MNRQKMLWTACLLSVCGLYGCSDDGMAVNGICGDGTVNIGEICDDGNISDGDGCSSNCTAIESGYTCPSMGGKCVKEGEKVCGDGILQAGEKCDDGNDVAGDGCSADCMLVESGFVCKDPGHFCEPKGGFVEGDCGNGVLNLYEVCDDGNTIGGDGCTADCRGVEFGYVCNVLGQPCKKATDPGKTDDDPNKNPTGQSVCGNGIVEGSEACDDMNTIAGDGCSSDCMTVEAGWTCLRLGGAGSCTLVDPGHNQNTPECGNGIVEAGEACDFDLYDELSDGDGCDLNCQIEDGWTCSIETGICTEIELPGCGNGIVENGEDCDSLMPVEYSDKKGVVKECTSTCRTAPYCGDGVVNGPETCDDGVNNVANDNAAYGKNDDGSLRCKSDCTYGISWRDGFSEEEMSQYLENPAILYCGDGIFTRSLPGSSEILEDCDPLSPKANGGCTDDCREKDGWSCSAVDGTCIENAVVNPDDPKPPVYVPACGNGTIDTTEECDDPANPGCSSDCMTVDGYKCQNSPKHCGVECVSTQCVQIKYGNGVLDADGYEQCDDGNTVNGDGCSSKGIIEPGYRCPTPGKACVAAACGDGIRAYGEECDDGNTKNGDGCNARCRIEDGAICSSNSIGSKSKCSSGSCGDGKVGKNEQCDNGSKTKNGTDTACYPNCKLINRNLGSCGNGTLETSKGEECDDGNKVGGDGCSPSCKIEAAFECFDNGKKNVCTAVCGDGITMWMLNGDAAEQCDDGNNISGDGCSADCKIEQGYTCTDFKNNLYPETISLPVTYRDFRRSDTTGSGNGFMTSDIIKKWTDKDSNCGRTPDKTNSSTNRSPAKGGYGHPDFQNFAGNLCKGLVKNDLSWDGKPVFSGNLAAQCTEYKQEANKVMGNHLLCGPSFDTWYRTDSKINYEVSGTIPMTRTDASKGIYVFDSQEPPLGTQYAKTPAYFNPLYNQGFKDHGQIPYNNTYGVYCYDASGKAKDCKADASYYQKYFTNQGITLSNYSNVGNKPSPAYQVNGGFTTEVATYFQYKPSRAGDKSTLNFTGDDDVWVYINGKLFVDLGGMHARISGENSLVAASCTGGKLCDNNYEVYEGGVYEMRIFNAEREYSGSNFKLTLTGFINSGKSTCGDTCGDKMVSAREECDEGRNAAEAEFKGCTTSCKKKAKCGNGLVEEGEQCDNGWLCQQSANASYCRDLGTSYNKSAKCNDQCKFTGSTCGNGVREGDEECDGKDTAPGTICLLNTCRYSVCGDGYVDPNNHEECDNGKSNGYGQCSKGCTFSRCGDGVIDEFNGEVCDDGINDGAYGHCGIGCTYMAPFCGDGVVQTEHGEKCDNGKNNNNGAYGGCNPDCTRASYCGDGLVDEANGEQCDGGKALNWGDCEKNCRNKVN